MTLPAATRPRSSLTDTVKHEPAALDLLERGLGHDPAADRGGGEVVELDPHARRGLPSARCPSTALTVASSHEGDDPRGGEHRHVAGGHRDGGVVVGDGQLDAGSQAGFDGHRRYDKPLRRPGCNPTRRSSQRSMQRPERVERSEPT